MRILVTGGSGYLGSAAVPALRARGHEVVTIGRHSETDAAVCDLTDGDAVHKAVAAVGHCEAVVHLAARAHDFRGLPLDELLLANATTTRNLVAALRDEGRVENVRFVHASSVAVYELLDAKQHINRAEAPYAASKIEAERIVATEPFQSLCVLRFAPIYDRAHLRYIANRVYCPGTKLKLMLSPPPRHTLCELARATQALADAVEASPLACPVVCNVSDPQPISQRDLAGWLTGPAVPLPTSLLRNSAALLARCGARARKLSRLIDKFTSSSTFPEPTVPI